MGIFGLVQKKFEEWRFVFSPISLGGGVFLRVIVNSKS